MDLQPTVFWQNTNFVKVILVALQIHYIRAKQIFTQDDVSPAVSRLQKQLPRQYLYSTGHSQETKNCFLPCTLHHCSQTDKWTNSTIPNWTGTFLKVLSPGMKDCTLLAEAFPLCFSALYCHSLRGFGCSRFVLVVNQPRKRPLPTAACDSC